MTGARLNLSLAGGVLLLLALSFAAGRCSGSSPDPQLRYVEVQVPSLPPAPDTVIEWRDRIVRVSVPVEQRASVPDAGLPRLAEFCAATEPAMPPADTREAPAPLSAGPRLSLAYAGRFTGNRLETYLLRTDGAQVLESHQVRAPLEWTISGDSLIVRGSRWWWLDDVAKIGGAALLGGALGYAAGTF